MKTYMKKAFLMLICLMAGWANGVGAKVTDDESAIRLDSMQVSGNMLAGMTQQATVNMSNIGSDDYEGYWYLFEQASPTEPKVLLSGTSVKAAAGRTATVRLKFELTEGAHTLLLAADGKGEQLLASAQVAMAPCRQLDMTASFELEMMTQEEDENVLYGRRMQGRLTVKNNERVPYMGVDHINTLASGITYRFVELESGKVLPTGNASTKIGEEIGGQGQLTKDISFYTGFKEFPDKMYALIASYVSPEGPVDIGSIEFRIKDGAFTYWTKDWQVKRLPRSTYGFVVPPEAVAVDLRLKTDDSDDVAGIIGYFDVSQANPNCLFYQDFFNENAGIGSGQIIVCEGEALNVNIDENHDFMCPMSFKARHAYFRFTPDCMSVPQPLEGSYLFETLVLPFDITYANLIDINASKKMAVIPNDTTEVTEPSPIFPYEENLLLAWQYIGDAGDSLTVSPVDLRTLRANYPYILSLRTRSCIGFGGEDTKVPATEPAVVKGQQFDFVGTTCARAATDTDYRYNTFSNAFCVMYTDDLIPPFRAFIDGSHATVAYDALKLPWSIRYWGPDAPTEATTVASERAAATDGEVYTLSGQHLGTADVRSLKPGLYIIGGRKVAIK